MFANSAFAQLPFSTVSFFSSVINKYSLAGINCISHLAGYNQVFANEGVDVIFPSLANSLPLTNIDCTSPLANNNVTYYIGDVTYTLTDTTFPLTNIDCPYP